MSLDLTEETSEHSPVRIGDTEGRCHEREYIVIVLSLQILKWLSHSNMYHIDVILRPCFPSKKSQCHSSKCCPLYNSLTFVSFLGWFHQTLISPKKSVLFCFFSWVTREFWRGPSSGQVIDECLVTAVAIKQGSFLK